MKRIMITIFLASSLAADTGAGVFDFLNIPQGARAAGMGGGFTAVKGDPLSIFWNPAGLSGVKGKTTLFNIRKYIAGINSGSIVYTNGKFGAGISYINFGKMEKRDAGNNYQGDFTSNVISPVFSYYQKMSQEIVLGTNLKAAYQKIDEYSAIGVALDLGVNYDVKDMEGLTISILARNLGKEVITFDGTDENLPLSLRLGAGYIPLSGYLLTVDIEQSLKEGTSFMLGAEAKFSPIFTLRGGYSSKGKNLKTDSPSDFLAGFSSGIGFKKGMFGLDYTVTPMADLGITHRISLSQNMR
jgi:hypothetical protein